MLFGKTTMDLGGDIWDSVQTALKSKGTFHWHWIRKSTAGVRKARL